MASCLRTFLCGTAAIVALSSAGIDGATAAAPGLVAAYSFDSSGTVVPDASGNGNSGTATNTTWVSSGRYGGAFSFDGSTSWVTVADSASLHVDTFTVEAWVNPKSALRTDWQAIAVRERSGGLVFGLYANSNRSRPAALASVGAAERSAYGASPLKGGTGTHLAETFDGSSLRIYANGKLASALAASGTLATSTSPLRFGGDAVWNEFFRGSIDDARVYSRALSAAEIATDMSTPVGSTPAPADAQRPSAPTGLHITSQTATSITAAWTGSTDNVGVTAYGLYRDGFALGSTSSTSAAFTGLGCGRSYALAVDAVDAAGNRSAQISLDATTSACADTTPPTTPGGLVASAVAETWVTLDWTASADATGVSGYGVYRDGAQTGASTTTSATVVGLTCASPYSLAVDAVDAAGNRSAKAAVAVTTAACSGSKTGASFFVAPGGS